MTSIYLITNQLSIENSFFNIATVDECYEYCKTKTELGLDIETTRKYNKYGSMEGLDPYTSDIVMLQIGDMEKQFVIDTRNVNISKLLPLLSDSKIKKIGHNLKFEYKHILHKYRIRINNLYDTMIAETVLTKGTNLPVSLKEVMMRYLNKDVDKGTRLGFLIIGGRPFYTNEILYGAEDITAPLEIYELQKHKLTQHELWNTVKLEFRFTCVLGEMEYNGINFNKEKWLKTYNENLIVYKQLINELNEFIILNFTNTKFVDKQLDLFKEGFSCNIQWSSSKQVIELFKFLNCCPQAVSKTTKKLAYTVEAKEVEAFLISNNLTGSTKDLIKLYLKTKEYEQAVTTFGEKFLKHVNPITQRVHSNYTQIINTGRISSSNPNNQNIPAKHEFRYAFDAAENCVIINADYGGQENIVLANKALDPDILEFYDKGMGDMHSFIASKLFPDKLTFDELKATLEKKENKLPLDARDKELLEFRQIAKAAGFALAYGGSGYTIAKNLSIPAETGDKVYNDYFLAFPGLKSYFDKVKEQALKRGYILIDTITNRKFYLKDIKLLKKLELTDYKAFNKLKGKMERTAMNYPKLGLCIVIYK